jgi:O-antigen ligase
MLGCVGIAAAALGGRMFELRHSNTLLAVNTAITVFTLTRGAIISALVVIAPAGWSLLRNRAGLRAEGHVLRIGAVAGVLAVLVIAAAPLVTSRNETSERSINAGDSSFNTSGRIDAWKEFYAIAQENPLFGRGLGAGPITHINTQGFRAQHNEYIRMLLEAGWFGAALLLSAIVAALVAAARAAPPDARPYLIALLLGFLVFSITDNTLSAPAFAVPFAVLFGAVASLQKGRAPHVA